MHLSRLNAAARVAQAVARALAVGGAPLKISEAVARSEPRLFRALFPGWISKPHTVFPDIHDKNRSEFVRRFVEFIMNMLLHLMRSLLLTPPACSQWMKDARDLRDFIKRSGMYVCYGCCSSVLSALCHGVLYSACSVCSPLRLFGACICLLSRWSYMVPSSRGKRWTVPDNIEDSVSGFESLHLTEFNKH